MKNDDWEKVDELISVPGMREEPDRPRIMAELRERFGVDDDEQLCLLLAQRALEEEDPYYLESSMTVGAVSKSFVALDHHIAAIGKRWHGVDEQLIQRVAASGDPRAVPILGAVLASEVTWLEDEFLDEAVRNGLYGLWKINTPEALELVARARQDPRPRVTETATMLYERMASTEQREVE